MRVRGQVTYELIDGVLVIGSYSNGGVHELCDAVSHLSSNSPKTLINAMACDYCLIKYSTAESDLHLLELGISRQIQTIINLKLQAINAGSGGAYQINKLMNSVYVEIKKIDQKMALEISETPKYKLFEASRMIAAKNTFSNGTRAALVKIGKVWSGLHLILSQFAAENTMKFEVSSRSITDPEDSFIFGRKGGDESHSQCANESVNLETAQVFSKASTDMLNLNIHALGDLDVENSWPRIPSGNPTIAEKRDYCEKRKETRLEILRLRNAAAENLATDVCDEEKIPSLLMIGETDRALHEEKINHETQKNKIRKFDLDILNRAVQVAGGNTLVDEMSIPDQSAYPKWELDLGGHTEVTKALVKELHSKLAEYEKCREEMQKRLAAKAEKIDKLCSSLAQLVEPEVVGNSGNLRRAYLKLRDLCHLEGVPFEEGEDYDSHHFDISEDYDSTWDPNKTTTSDTEFMCSFDRSNMNDSKSSQDSQNSFIFQPKKRVKQNL